MNVDAFLREIEAQHGYQGQVVHVHDVAQREAQYAEPAEPLHPAVKAALEAEGITRLYSHQVTAVDAIRRGENVVVVTGTASGKTLCYNIPVLERLLEDPRAKAFYLFPTKALAQDQLRVLNRWKETDPSLPVEAGTFDGDTPRDLRRKLRDQGNVILTNPDMLHTGILPNHSRWSDFFAQLRFVVLDEIHTYRGVFGSQVAAVMRRLRRICEHYSADPQFVCCSATIANPDELARALIGKPVTLVDNDGSPSGPRKFVLWNPPFTDEGKMERRSPNTEAQRLMTSLIKEHIPTITFVRARVVAELLYRYVQNNLMKGSPRLAGAVRAYRGGYLPEERREIEQKLFNGELLGVTTTTALELGIDIGSLDACIIVGYPGSVASTLQQAGRAGRREEEALVILIAQNTPIDQYLMQHPEYFFGQTPEHAIVDPHNPHIAAAHLRCAAAELPVTAADEEAFGEYTPALMEILEEGGEVTRQRDRWYWRGRSYPARDINLRNMDENNYLIQDEGNDNAVIGMVDEYSAFTLLHDQAIYMHRGETYFVNRLDLSRKVAYVERGDFDYYTQAIDRTDIKIDEVEESKRWRVSEVNFGAVTVTTLVYMFRKIKFFSRDSVGFGNLDLPTRELQTTALWIIPPAAALARVREFQRIPEDGLLGIANVASAVLPLFVMCDPLDLGSLVDSSQTGSATIFLFDRYPGGLGLVEKGYELIDQVMEACLLLIRECGCDEGCPSCVGSPLPGYQAGSDQDTRGKIPDKEAARCILHDLLELEPYVPKPPSRQRRELIEQGPTAGAPAAAAAEKRSARPRKRLPEGVERRIRERLNKLKERRERGPSDGR